MALPALFADNFRKNRVLKRQVASVIKRRKRLGPCQRATLRPPNGFLLHHRDRRQVGRIYVDGAGKITGPWFEAELPAKDSLLAVAAAMQKLPGQVAITVRPVTGAPLLSVNADKPLAVASTFKLYVLKALLAESRELAEDSDYLESPRDAGTGTH